MALLIAGLSLWGFCHTVDARLLRCDMIVFGNGIALAIYFRKRPEYHRRLVFIASCQLIQAAFDRFDYVGYPESTGSISTSCRQ